MDSTGESRDDEPMAERIDKEAEQRELEAAGWELVERGGGKTIWRNPRSGHLYPQSVAITMVREGPSPAPGDRT